MELARSCVQICVQSKRKSSYDYARNCLISNLWSHWETPLSEYPYNQRFILGTFVNSNIRSYGVLHRFSSRCFAGAIGIHHCH